MLTFPRPHILDAVIKHLPDGATIRFPRTTQIDIRPKDGSAEGVRGGDRELYLAVQPSKDRSYKGQ